MDSSHRAVAGSGVPPGKPSSRFTRARAAAYLVAATALSMAGCQHQSAPGVVFEVVPAMLRQCEKATAITVRWKVDRPGTNEVQLLVRSVGGRPKLWTRGQAEGVATTGPWATVGFTIFLEDLDGNILARRSMPEKDC